MFATGGGGVPTSDPVDSADVSVLLLPTQTPADMHFGQLQGDGNTWNQNPTADQWTFPTAGLIQTATSPDTATQPGTVLKATVKGTHAPVTASERRTEFSFRGAGTGYDYWLTNGTTYWWWLRYYMPDRSAYSSGDHVSPWQVHAVTAGNPPAACYLSGTTTSIGGADAPAGTFTQPMGQWVTDILQVKLDPGGTGLLKVWRDGTLVYDESGFAFGISSQFGYIKHGTYVFPGGTGAATYNDFTSGSPTYSELAVYSAGAGLIEDTGYTQTDIANHVGYQTGSAV
jgi:hypothetical protein